STAKTNSGMNAEAKDGAVKVDGMASITGEASAESDNRGKTFRNRYERRKASHRDNVRGKNTGGGTGRTGAGGSGRTGAGGSGKSGKNGGSAGGKFNKGKR
ncbi:MAG: hypothetical protein HGA22_08360, partial [Clostridiales bacterium]|nr:hypothetical protein [Clostridiales bacterium]